MKMWKKLFAVTLAIVMVLAVAPPQQVQASRPITVTVDGVTVVFPDQEPVMVENHVLVPVYGVFTHMGFEAAWDSVTRTATLTGDGFIVVVTAGESTFTVNGEVITPVVPQRIIAGRMMLPLGAVARAVGAEANWDSANRTAMITTAAADDIQAETPADIAAVSDFLVGVWGWDGNTDDHRFYYIFYADGTGYRGVAPGIERFSWTVEYRPGFYVINFYHGGFVTELYGEDWRLDMASDPDRLEMMEIFYNWETTARLTLMGGEFNLYSLEYGWSFDYVRVSYTPPADPPERTLPVGGPPPSDHPLIGMWVRDGADSYAIIFYAYYIGHGSRGVYPRMQRFTWAVSDSGHLRIAQLWDIESWTYTIADDSLILENRYDEGQVWRFYKNS